MDMTALAETIGDLLLKHHLTLAVAESCTGGLLSAHITAAPGSSAYFAGGAVTYSNAAKERILAVPSALLLRYGAVSAEIALAMARGVRALLQVDVSLAITGIAGPGGDTPDKPVGLIYVALSAHDADLCQRHLWAGDRMQNRELSARAALEMLRDYLLTRQPANAGA